MMDLRYYQESAITQIRKKFANGHKRVLLHLSTGAGKTVIFCEMMKRAVLKDANCIMVVRGKQLVEQASQRLFRENVDHGVLQGNHWNLNHDSKIQLCSIDTLIVREMFPRANLVIIDEAHLFVSQKCRDFLDRYKDSYIVSVTATPYPDQAIDHLATTVVAPITTKELIEKGYLVPAKYFSPSIPDLKGIATSGGDYLNKELETRMNKLTSDIPGHWNKFAKDRPTIMFAVNIAHSKALVAQFNSEGIAAEHIEGETDVSERIRATERLRTGEIKVLSNVGVLCTGVDLPFVSAIIMARPTKSLNLYLQQAGRGTRPYQNKNDFVILDHASNILRHGFITDEIEVILDPSTPRIGRTLNVVRCEQCFLVYQGVKCPECKWVPSPNKKEMQILFDSISLEELATLPRDLQISIYTKRLKKFAKLKGYKRGYVYHKLKALFGEKVASEMCPQRIVPDWIK